MATVQPIIVTQDECTYGALAHALQMPGFWIAPLVIMIVRRDSLFVRFHALQALLLQAVKVILIMGLMLIWFALIFSTVFTAQQHPHAAPPTFIFLVFPFIWLGWMGFFALEITLTILYALKAGRGEWAGYPLLGILARKFLGIASSSTQAI